MAFYNKIKEFYDLIDNNINTRLNETIDEILNTIPLTSNGGLVLNYLKDSGISGDVTIQRLLSTSKYFIFIDKAIKLTYEVLNIEEFNEVSDDYDLYINPKLKTNKLVIDGDENDYYKYGSLSFYFSPQNRLPYSDIVINNIQGTPTVRIVGYLLKNLSITNSVIESLFIEAPQLTSYNLPSGLNYFYFIGDKGINNQRFGLTTAPDLTLSENTLTEIYLILTQIQFTDVNYFQINNKANIIKIDLQSSAQINNTLPLGLFDGLIGLNSRLGLSEMNLQDIPLGLFSFLGAGNVNLEIDLTANELTQTAIDNIITDCLDRATNNGAINIILALTGGTNAIPSAQALTDIGTLTGTYGWTVVYNT